MCYVHIITGNGKGKTTAAVGLAVRAAGAGKRVAFLQFDKGYDGTNEHYNERHVLRRIPEIDLFPYGCERMRSGQNFRFENIDDDFAEADRALEKAGELIEAGAYGLIILDEILSARACKLVEAEEILDLVQKGRNAPTDGENDLDLVLTGRSATQPMIDAADLVSDVQPVKHYFDQGVAARPGIEF